MPPALATLIFVVFILWTLRRYGKTAMPVSFGLVIAFLWLGNNITRPIGYWLADGTAAASAQPSDGSFVDRNFYLILMTLAVITLLRRPIEWSRFFHEMQPLLWFQAYLLLSCLWSVEPYIAFKRWFKDAGELLIMLLILTSPKPVETLKGIFVRCAIIFIPLSVLFMKYYPDIGRYYHKWTWTWAFCGVTTNKNSLGLLAMLSGLFLLWYLVDILKYRDVKAYYKAWPELIILAMCVWIVSVAGSATALVSFLVGALVFFVIRLPWVRFNMRILAVSLAVVATMLIVLTLSNDVRAIAANLLGKDATLTDRTLIWDASLKMGTNPLIGSGFSSTWLTPEAVPVVEEFHNPHAHNAYLETYLHTGLVGLIFLACILIRSVRTAATHLIRQTEVGPFFVALFVSGLIYNYTEVTFNRSNVFGFLLFLMSAFAVRHAASVTEGAVSDEEKTPDDLFGVELASPSRAAPFEGVLHAN